MTDGSDQLLAAIRARREETRALRAKLEEINAQLARIDALMGRAPGAQASVFGDMAEDRSRAA